MENNTEKTLKKLYLALKQSKAKLKSLEEEHNQPIAIIGMGMRLPGNVKSPETLWELLKEGRDATSEVPSDRWNADHLYNPSTKVKGKMYTQRGGFLSESVADFDADFFSIAPKEARAMDPQQRLLLEVTWECLERAAINPDHLAGSKTGVYLGMTADDYAKAHRQGDLENIDAYSMTGSLNCVASGRIAYILGLQGPAITIDTACSSALVALHLASSALRKNECHLALAGGVNLLLTPNAQVCFSQIQAISPDGRSKTFDASADGYSRGEGAGMVALKRLSDAIKDQDRIYATILGSAVNQDGRSNGLTAPNGNAQRQVIKEALANAGVQAHQVGYLEAHGTGTPLGDPIELEAASQVYGQDRSSDSPIWIGSIKTNIGHLEAAAGIAGFLKVVLSLKNKAIPPHLHFKNPNPHFDWEQVAVKVPSQLTDWPSEQPRMAGISSFGFSGTNAHLILSEAPQVDRDDKKTAPHQVVCLSAANPKALSQLATHLASHLKSNPDHSLSDVCFSLAHRATLTERFAFSAKDRSAAIQGLEDFVAKPPRQKESSGKGLVMIFNDQGHLSHEAVQLCYQNEPVFQAALDQCGALLQPVWEQNLCELLFHQDPKLKDSTYAQPALFSVLYATYRLWSSWGVQPRAFMGCGVGEFVAGVVAQIFNLETAINLLALRGRLLAQQTDPQSLSAQLQDSLRDIQLSQANEQLISSRNGDFAGSEISDPEYWCTQFNRETSIKDSLKTLSNNGFDLYLELSPEPGLDQQLSSDFEITIIPGLETPDGQLAQALAALFISGSPLKWDNYYRHKQGQALDLPTYPFQRNRYWMLDGVNETSQFQHSSSQGHPLLGQKLDSPLQATVFQQELSPFHPSWLQKFLSNERILLPASAYIEMMLSAIPTETTALSQISFEHHLLVGDKTQLQLIIEPSEQGNHCLVYSKNQDEPEWKCNARAETKPLPEAKSIDFKKLRQSCSESLVPSELSISHFRDDNFYEQRDYGIETLSRGDQAAIARIKLNLDQGETQPYQLHPLALDSCFQVMASLLPAQSHFTKLKNISLYQPLGERFEVIVKRSNTQNDMTSLELFILNSHDELLAHIEEIECHSPFKSLEEKQKNEANEPSLPSIRKTQVAASFLEELRALPMDERNLFLKNRLEHHLREVTYLEDDEPISHRRPFLKFGMDSLMAVELQILLEEDLEIDLTSTVFFDHPCLEALLKYIQEHILADDLDVCEEVEENETNDLEEDELAELLQSRLAVLEGSN